MTTKKAANWTPVVRDQEISIPLSIIMSMFLLEKYLLSCNLV